MSEKFPNLKYKLFVLRLLVGGFFVWVGVDKVMEPQQNFLYVIQGYQIFPELLEGIIAVTFPWIELLMGIFLVLGLWTKSVLRAFLLVIFAFILIICQALVRKLPIKFCGCFGGLFSSEIQHTLLFDICLFFLVYLMLRGYEHMGFCSLDKYFSEKKN
jgi:hypothetical protein